MTNNVEPLRERLPNESLPNEGLPNEGLPNEGLPNEGLPNEGLPNEGLPNEGLPNAGVATVMEQQTVEIRRSPRYFRLMALGAGLGAIAAYVSTFALPPVEGYSRAQVFGFMLLFGIVAGGVLGAIVALVLDRLVGRRTLSLVANKVAVNEYVAPIERSGTSQRVGEYEPSESSESSEPSEPSEPSGSSGPSESSESGAPA